MRMTLSLDQAVQLKDKYDLFFYDGPHDEQSVINAVKHYKNYFADTL